MSAAETTAASIARYTGTCKIDLDGTDIEFHTKAVWIFPVTGRAKALSGAATIDSDGDIRGKLTVDASSIATGNKKRDAHLQTADFFETDVHPTIEFEVTGGRLLDSGQAELSGSLTVHGQTRPFTVIGTLDLDDDSGSVTLSAEIDDLDRKDWGLTWSKMGASTHNRVSVKARFVRG